MEFTLNKRLQNIKPSATLAMAAKAQELKSQGRDIISLATGEPDFDTAEHIKAAAIKAMQEGFTKYTPVDGIPDLKEAICNKFKKDNGLNYQHDQIIVSTGAKQSIYNALQVILNDKDEVIIPAPYWVSYPDMVKLAGGVPIVIETRQENQFRVTAEQLDSYITASTKLIILNSPSNPTGTAYDETSLKSIAELLKDYPDILVMTDDIYEYILWNHAFCNLPMVAPELYERTLTINGVSKAYAMTGWRIGYAAGPKPLIAAMKKIQSQSTSNPNGIAQKAAVAAISGSQDIVSTMVEAFKKRHDIVFERLSKIPGINATPSDGTFYIFPNVEGLMSRLNIDSDVTLSEMLLERTGIAMVPGTAFGAPGHIRLSYATGEEILDKALGLLEEFANG